MSADRQPSISPRPFTLAVVAIAAFNALLSLAFAFAVRDQVWSVDIARNVSAARDLAAGEFGRNRGYLYSPLAALITVPATWLPTSALVGAITAAGVATLIGLAALGTGPYQAYVDILRHPEYLDSPQYGNLAVTSLAPAIALLLAVLTVLGAVVALHIGEAPGLLACLAAGLLLAPYTMGYGPVMMLLAFRPLLAVAPVRTFLLAVSGSIMVFVSLPIWALAWIGSAVVVPRGRWVRLMSAVAR